MWLGPAPLLLALPLLLASSVHVPCARYVLIHEGHEGSHAIEDEMARSFGTFSIREIGDGRQTGKLTEAVRSAFATGNKTQLSLLFETASRDTPDRNSYLKRARGIKEVNCTAGQVIGALAHIEQSAMFADPGVAIFVLVRTDLMRWALSLSKSVTARGCINPQFGLCARPEGKHHINIPKLKQEARKLISKWKGKAKFATHIARGKHLGSGASFRCPRVLLVSYEAFLEGRDEVVSHMFAHVQRHNRLAKSLPTPHPQVEGVKKVHLNEIEKWVSNYQEVQNMFQKARFPSFVDVVRESGFAELCPQSLLRKLRVRILIP
ncbi:hypothetical protein T492DRAFT_1140976 [Pavlovales sp. CCMP2436]|nr:hypothetical protein T492DRAFT_1140976 [Pavlovales sp. CCMP2436]